MATAKAKKETGATGTAVAVKKSSAGALVSLKEQMAAELAALAQKTLPPTGAKIKAAKGMFKLPDGTEAATIDVVIIDFITGHNYYPGKYDPKNIVPPVCAARGDIPTALVPFDDSPEVQSEGCAACPMNQFGSSGDGKACKNSRLAAVLPPDAAADDPIWLVEVSPTAIKGFDGYVGSVARQFQLPPIGVVTTISLDDTVDYAKMIFGSPRPNENLEVHFARKAEAREMLMAKPDFSKVAMPTNGKAPVRKTARR